MRRVLLDEGVPRQLAQALRSRGLETIAFPNEWKRLGDGALLDLALRQGFDVLVTGDKNMPFQQNIAGRAVAVLILPGVDRKRVSHYASFVATAIEQLPPGSFTYLEADGRLRAGRMP